MQSFGCFEPHRERTLAPAGDILTFDPSQPAGHLSQMGVQRFSERWLAGQTVLDGGILFAGEVEQDVGWRGIAQ